MWRATTKNMRTEAMAMREIVEFVAADSEEKLRAMKGRSAIGRQIDVYAHDLQAYMPT